MSDQTELQLKQIVKLWLRSARQNVEHMGKTLSSVRTIQKRPQNKKESESGCLQKAKSSIWMLFNTINQIVPCFSIKTITFIEERWRKWLQGMIFSPFLAVSDWFFLKRDVKQYKNRHRKEVKYVLSIKELFKKKKQFQHDSVGLSEKRPFFNFFPNFSAIISKITPVIIHPIPCKKVKVIAEFHRRLSSWLRILKSEFDQIELMDATWALPIWHQVEWMGKVIKAGIWNNCKTLSECRPRFRKHVSPFRMYPWHSQLVGFLLKLIWSRIIPPSLIPPLSSFPFLFLFLSPPPHTHPPHSSY